MQDAYFDYDKSDIRSDARDALTRDAAALKAILADFPNATIMVEGHCDERGSAEYNLGLGDRRASFRQGLPGIAGRSRRPAEDHQLRQGTAAVHGSQTKPAGRRTAASTSRPGSRIDTEA